MARTLLRSTSWNKTTHFLNSMPENWKNDIMSILHYNIPLWYYVLSDEARRWRIIQTTKKKAWAKMFCGIFSMPMEYGTDIYQSNCRSCKWKRSGFVFISNHYIVLIQNIWMLRRNWNLWRINMINILYILVVKSGKIYSSMIIDTI